MVVILCLSIFGVFTSEVKAEQNLIVNPGFENNLTGWSKSEGTTTYTVDATTSHSGSYSVKGIETDTESLGRLYQDITGIASLGDEYQIEGWIKTSNVIGSVVIAVDYVDQDGWTPLDGYVMDWIGDVSGTQDWAFFQSPIFTLPPMPSDAQALWFLLDFNNGAGTAWWDDVSLVCVQSAGVKIASVFAGGTCLISASDYACLPDEDVQVMVSCSNVGATAVHSRVVLEIWDILSDTTPKTIYSSSTSGQDKELWLDPGEEEWAPTFHWVVPNEPALPLYVVCVALKDWDNPSIVYDQRDGRTLGNAPLLHVPWENDEAIVEFLGTSSNPQSYVSQGLEKLSAWGIKQAFGTLLTELGANAVSVFFGKVFLDFLLKLPAVNPGTSIESYAIDTIGLDQQTSIQVHCGDAIPLTVNLFTGTNLENQISVDVLKSVGGTYQVIQYFDLPIIPQGSKSYLMGSFRIYVKQPFVFSEPGKYYIRVTYGTTIATSQAEVTVRSSPSSYLPLVQQYFPCWRFSKGEKWYPCSFYFDDDVDLAGNKGNYEGGLFNDPETGKPPFYVYIHLAEDDHELAIQYWLYYVYNDHKVWTKHMNDWDSMVMIVFDKLNMNTPKNIGFSTHILPIMPHDWNDPTIEKHNGHPVAYVAEGSHGAYPNLISLMFPLDEWEYGGITLTNDNLTNWVLVGECRNEVPINGKTFCRVEYSNHNCVHPTPDGSVDSGVPCWPHDFPGVGVAAWHQPNWYYIIPPRASVAGVVAHSPVNLYVQDNVGRITGFKDGTVLMEIPDAQYTGPDTEPEMILLLNPSGQYTIHVRGTNYGTFNISVSEMLPDGSTVTNAEFTNVAIAPDQEVQYQVAIPEFPPAAILAVFMALTVLAAALTRKNRSKRFN